MNEELLFANCVMLFMVLVFYFSARSESRHTKDWKHLAEKWKEAYELWRGVAEKYAEVVKVYKDALASPGEGARGTSGSPTKEGTIPPQHGTSVSEGTPK